MSIPKTQDNSLYDIYLTIKSFQSSHHLFFVMLLYALHIQCTTNHFKRRRGFCQKITMNQVNQ